MEKQNMKEAIVTMLRAIAQMTRTLDPDYESISISISDRDDPMAIYDGKCISLFTIEGDDPGATDFAATLNGAIEIFNIRG